MSLGYYLSRFAFGNSYVFFNNQDVKRRVSRLGISKRYKNRNIKVIINEF